MSTITNDHDELLIDLYRGLSKECIAKLKFVSLGIEGLPLETFQGAENLIDIRKRIKNVITKPEDSITFIYHVLKALKCESEHSESSISQCHIIKEDYDLSVLHTCVSYRILVLACLEELSTEDYNGVKRVVQSVLRVNRDRFTTKVRLAEYMFNEGILQNHTDIEPIRTLSNTSHSRELINEYSKTINERDPEAEDCAENNVDKRNKFIEKLTEHRSKLEHQLSCQKHQDSYRNSNRSGLWCLRILIGIFILICCLLVIGGVVTTYKMVSYRGISDGSVNISDHNILALNDEGFGNNLDSVYLTLVNKDDSIAINIYQDKCDTTNISSLTLHEVSPPELYAPYGFKRQPYNYNKLDTPLFALKGSTMEFNVTAIHSSDFNTSMCLKIRIFNDRELYMDAIDPGEKYMLNVEGTIAESHCLSVDTLGPPGTSNNWTYTLTKAQYVYATIDVGLDVTVTGSITGQVKRYQVDQHLLLPCSPLTSDSPHCEVKICGGKCVKPTAHPLQCIYLQLHDGSGQETTEYKVLYSTELPIYKLSFFISGGLASLAIILLIVLIYLGYKCCQCCRCASCTSNQPPSGTCTRQDSNDSNRYLLDINSANTD